MFSLGVITLHLHRHAVGQYDAGLPCLCLTHHQVLAARYHLVVQHRGLLQVVSLLQLLLRIVVLQCREDFI
jgi:hypothetical protein